MPPVPRSWTAIMRSTSRGPRRTRASPAPTVKRVIPAARERSRCRAQNGAALCGGCHLLRDKLTLLMWAGSNPLILTGGEAGRSMI